jgi:phosphoribosylformylglycinamidine cyclo-ligase
LDETSEDQSAYARAGVDIDAGRRLAARIKGLARSTARPEVLAGVGPFASLFRLAGYSDPVLVASADGVGTKLKVAFMTDRHDTVGVDLVNHCVNDILVQGAEPLFFLDYLATGRLAPDVAASIVEGMARACRENGCALLGGETAEMPGFYGDGEYDLAGFIVGAVDRSRVIDGRGVTPGDALIGLPSSGLHTNGYSLARRIVFDTLGLSVGTYLAEVGLFVGEALLTPHRSYLPVVRPLLADRVIKGMAHITGGGITENLPRMLPDGAAASVRRSAWRPLPIFEFLQDRGEVPDDDMWRTFNMGMGLILAVSGADASAILARLHAAGETGAAAIGEIVPGPPGVRYSD